MAAGLGKKFGPYEIIERIGVGAMGEVYRAKQPMLNREIAIKVLHDDVAKDKSLLERFQREGKAVAKLEHPNIVAGIDVGQVDGRFYFAMEVLEGKALDAVLEGILKMSEVQALEIVKQVALALGFAHSKGYLHRDVKPENIMLTNTGVVKLMDLGLARPMNVDPGMALTQEGQAVGTPDYMSPEQAQGFKDLTSATDLYSLGAVLYRMITGKLPFDGDNYAIVMLNHIQQPVPDPRVENPEVTEPTASLCMRMLAKKVEDRPASGEAIAEEIEQILFLHQSRADAQQKPDVPAVPASEDAADKAKRPNRPGTGAVNRLSRVTSSESDAAAAPVSTTSTGRIPRRWFNK